MNKPCIIELHYLPCIEWFAQVLLHDEVIVERHEHYEKQSYRNRCHIRAAHGLHRLIIPVKVHGKVPVHQVKIDYSQKWVNNHWRTLTSAYRLSPFFEHYEEELHRLMYTRFVSLYELNLALLRACLKWLKADIRISESPAFRTQYDNSVTDLRNLIHPKKKPIDSLSCQIRYTQVFGMDFMDNLSIIDLLSCEGPHAAVLLKPRSRTN